MKAATQFRPPTPTLLSITRNLVCHNPLFSPSADNPSINLSSYPEVSVTNSFNHIVTKRLNFASEEQKKDCPFCARPMKGIKTPQITYNTLLQINKLEEFRSTTVLPEQSNNFCPEDYG